ncbi:hypothetical protein IMSAGC019_02186 [Lachnospiraceae bacterium]|nr:hypothetical protein IMSAGC019_02186 [Lachnospiraceae bacterium]
MPDDIKYRVPLGLCRHAVMKLDAFMADIHEIKEDEELSPEDRQIFEQIAEISGEMMAAIVNMVTKEMGEEEFLSEDVVMDKIDRNLYEI